MWDATEEQRGEEESDVYSTFLFGGLILLRGKIKVR